MNIKHLSVRCWPALLALGATSVVAQALPETTMAEVRALAREAAITLAPPGARIEVLPGALDGRLRLAPCARITSTLLPGARAWGATRVGLRCAEGSTRWSVSLPVTVKVFAPALLAGGSLPAGAVIEPGQFRLGEVDWAAESSAPHNQASAIVGRSLARPLAAGQALRSADLRPHQWFAAGDTVRIVATGGGFEISAEGQAMSNGIEGQPARVRTESGRLITGLPSGERRIEVSL